MGQLVDIGHVMPYVDIRHEKGVFVCRACVQRWRQTDFELLEVHELLPNAVRQRQVNTQPATASMSINARRHVESWRSIRAQGDPIGSNNNTQRSRLFDNGPRAYPQFEVFAIEPHRGLHAVIGEHLSFPQIGSGKRHRPTLLDSPLIAACLNEQGSICSFPHTDGCIRLGPRLDRLGQLSCRRWSAAEPKSA